MSAVVLFQSVIDGLLIGGVYAIIGLGLSLAYGVMGVVNWAYGESLMVAMFISFLLTKYAGFDPYLTAVISIVVLGGLGYFLQGAVFNKLLNRGKDAWRDILLFTAGLGTVLTSTFNILFGAEVKSVNTRYSGMFAVGPMMISKPKLISFILAAIFCIGLYFIIQKTDLGRSLRATAQDRNTSQLMGINANQVYCICFAISMAMVGISGALLTPFYSVNPYVGATFSLKSFIIVAIGGKGNISGTMVAGILIGVIEKVVGVFLGDNIAQVFIFILFIVFLLVKPNGLLSRQERV